MDHLQPAACVGKISSNKSSSPLHRFNMLRNEDADLLWVVHSYRKKYAKVAGVNLATYDAAIWLALGHYRRILSFLKFSRSQNVVFGLCLPFVALQDSLKCSLFL
jgi:hypothetical protein